MPSGDRHEVVPEGGMFGPVESARAGLARVSAGDTALDE